MVRRAAERQRNLPAGKSGQEHLEIRRVFHREQLCQRAILIVRRQASLHAAEGGTLPEGRGSLAELIRLGPVLGVVDDHEVAARKGQREGQRLRLGAWSAGGHDDQLEDRLFGEAGRRNRRLDVVGLEEQQNLKL
jgi:hypothetical protein